MNNLHNLHEPIQVVATSVVVYRVIPQTSTEALEYSRDCFKHWEYREDPCSHEACGGTQTIENL